ncbi:MAG: reverse transcriptase-like protein [Halolamina sp.]
MGLAPSLFVSFDASVLYAADNATPTSGAIGYVVEDATTVHVEGSRSVEAFVSNTALEYRALAAAARAVDERFDRVGTLHVHGDADAVIRAVDPDDESTPSERVARRRVEAVRERLADVPTVTYRAVSRERNGRAHDLARAGHDPDGEFGRDADHDFDRDGSDGHGRGVGGG